MVVTDPIAGDDTEVNFQEVERDAANSATIRTMEPSSSASTLKGLVAPESTPTGRPVWEQSPRSWAGTV